MGECVQSHGACPKRGFDITTIGVTSPAGDDAVEGVDAPNLKVTARRITGDFVVDVVVSGRRRPNLADKRECIPKRLEGTGLLNEVRSAAGWHNGDIRDVGVSSRNSGMTGTLEHVKLIFRELSEELPR